MNIDNLTSGLASLIECMVNTEVEADPQDPRYNESEVYEIDVETEGEPDHLLKLMVFPVRWLALNQAGGTSVQRTLKVSVSLTEVVEKV